MALDSYTAISAAIGTWGTRTYSSTQTDDFLALAEAAINRRLGTDYRRDVASTLTTDSSGEVALPAGFVAMRSLVKDEAGARPMAATSWDSLTVIDPYSVGVEPTHYAIRSGTLKVSPIYEGDFNAIYQTTLAALSPSNASNWLLAAAPDVYLFYGRAAQAAFEEEFQTAAIFEAKGGEALNEIVAQGQVAQYANAEMVLDFITP